MGQILHGSAKTTHAVRAGIQRSKSSIAEIAEQYELNPKTVMKWRDRDTVEAHPNMAELYRRKVTELQSLLIDEATRPEAWTWFAPWSSASR
jgi:hypothetical protein